MNTIALAVVLGHPRVGQLGQDLLADVVQGNGEHSLFAAQDNGVALGIGRIAVSLREGHGDIKGLAGGVAYDLILKAIDESTAAQGQAVAAVSAAAERNAIHGTGIVDVDGIAVRCSTVRHLLLGGVVAEQAVDLALDLLLGGLDLRTLEGKACKVLGQGDIVKRFHALPVAVLVQTAAVGEVLVIVIFRAAVNSGGCAGSGRRRISGLGAACCAQHQRTGAEQADCLCDDLFQNKVPPVGTPASRRVQIRVA